MHNGVRVSLEADEGGKETLSMRRRQYQHGSIRRKGKNWTLRYREYVYDSAMALKAINRTRVLIPANRTKSEARLEADKFMAQFGQISERPRTLATLSEFWEIHFTPNVISNLKPSTQSLYRTLAKTHLFPALGEKRLMEITRLDVQRLINSKRAAGYSPQTLAHLRNLLSKVFGSAVRWDMIPTNYASEIELPAMVRTRTARVLTQDEVSKLAGNLTEPALTIFMAGILLGLRIGELLALQVGDVDLTRASISIGRDVYRGKVGTPKTAAGARILPLPAGLLHRFKPVCDGKKPGDWIFPNACGTPLNDKNLMHRQIEPICDKLGIQRFGWHALRHTFSTFGGNSGIPMPVLQSLLGHTSAEITMRYTHPMEDAKRSAIDSLESQLWPAVA